ncbi:MAG: thioredoxin domain-containing protein, partial [Deltaproteobacteria bacterium]|nr:thioredoxin domain-containing protein [Deltaproteobacteria bacterium]
PIVVVTYSDFQCFYCKKGFETIEQLRNKYKGKIVFVFKHLPLSVHPWAMPAAKRFEAIALQNPQKAYLYHDELFKNQESIESGGESFLDETAKKLKVDMAKMKKDMESDSVQKQIDADMAEAKSFGIEGTPGFIVMGVSLKGAYPIETFEYVINRKNADKKSGR